MCVDDVYASAMWSCELRRPCAEEHTQHSSVKMGGSFTAQFICCVPCNTM